MREPAPPLWAPWRMDFIQSPRDSVCFLCHNEIPSTRDEESLIVKRMEYSFLMLNRYPYNCGHLLAAPYRHEGDLAALTTGELHELMDACVLAKQALARLMSPHAYNIGFNLGAAAGAGVAEHLHMHIVPRWNGDTNFMPVIADTRVIPMALEKTAALFREVLQSL